MLRPLDVRLLPASDVKLRAADAKLQAGFSKMKKREAAARSQAGLPARGDNELRVVNTVNSDSIGYTADEFVEFFGLDAAAYFWARARSFEPCPRMTGIVVPGCFGFRACHFDSGGSVGSDVLAVQDKLSPRTCMNRRICFIAFALRGAGLPTENIKRMFAFAANLF